MSSVEKNKECCPKFNPAGWDGKFFEWDAKKFIKDRVFTLFYIPFGFSKVITRMFNTIEKADAKDDDPIWISDHTSKWNMDLYVSCSKSVPGADNVTISGKFFSKVYEGNFKDLGAWQKEFATTAKEQGVDLKKTYLFYTSCPKCAKKYGKNYVVIIGQIR